MLAATAPTTDRSMHPGEYQTKARLQGVVEKRSAQPNRSPAAASMWPKGL